jgi:hypothetical protein
MRRINTLRFHSLGIKINALITTVVKKNPALEPHRKDAAPAQVTEHYFRNTCDGKMWRYGIVVIADVALRCKLNLICGVKNYCRLYEFNRICRRALHFAIII